MTKIDHCEQIRLTLIANAAALQHCTQTEGTEIVIPATRTGTGKRILIGTDEYLARVALPATNTTAGIDLAQLDKLEALARAATPGPWDIETVRSEGEYGTDEDGGWGFDAYAVVDSKGRPMQDSLNRDDSSIHTDTDGDVFYAWDELAKRDAQFIAAANPATLLPLIALARRSLTSGAPAEPFGTYVERDDGTTEFQRTGKAFQPTAQGYKFWTLYAAPVHDAATPSRECEYPHETDECLGCGWKSAGAAAKTEQAPE